MDVFEEYQGKIKKEWLEENSPKSQLASNNIVGLSPTILL